MRVVTVGVAGGTGSGKTTLVQTLIERIGVKRVAFLPHDAYYRDLSHLSLQERVRINFDHPESLETELLATHLRQLQASESIAMPQYDFVTHTRRRQRVIVQPRPLILVEGILIFVDPALRELFDIKLYVDTDADVRLIRRLQRDIEERGRTVESVIDQYLATVRPMHLEFVEPSKRYADLIVPEGGFNVVALDMIVARIEAILNAPLSDAASDRDAPPPQFDI
jgi:uridine kinase